MTQLAIVGPSGRAAAFSALRAGLSPRCLDLFADRDLALVAPVERLTGPFPEALLNAFASLPQGPWLYTGILENHPELLARLQQIRPLLWGNEAQRVRRVRDRHWLADCCREVGLAMPPEGNWPPGPGRWLIKPIRSGGGREIRPWSQRESERRPPGVYVQAWQAGQPVGVVFVGLPGRVQLLGATQQLVGLPWLGGGPFAYQGSVGPIDLPEALRSALSELAARLDLRGLFGIDGLLDGPRFWVLEVNPRYSASVEVLEQAGSFAALAWHRAAFDSSGEASGLPSFERIVAKAIVYAKNERSFPNAGPWDASLRLPVTALRPFADLPEAGAVIAAGAPICTVWAAGATISSVLGQIYEQVQECGL
ncbi:MAG: ATP-grasp domain-containing protein [Gemmataceae bacterium]